MPKSLKAKDIMTKDVIMIGPDSILAEAIKKLIENKISGMPVVDEDGKLLGIISEKDILNFAFCGYLRNTKVRKAMSTKVVSFNLNDGIEKLAVSISKYHFRRVPIIDEEKVVGIVSRRDIIRNVLKVV